MSFKSGDEVVCISPGINIGLKKDKIYTVVEATVDVQGEPCLMLLEAIPPDFYHNYLAYRFRKALPSELQKIKKEKLSMV